MKLIYLTTLLASVASFTALKFRNPFLQAQDSGWYPFFLQPVSDSIIADKNIKTVLDIGTGPGKLPEMLIKKDSNLRLTGIDINASMIQEAKKRVSHPHVTFMVDKAGQPLPFENASFDAVTLCSVLFLLDDSAKSFLAEEALRVLKPGGKLIVLTPSGSKSVSSACREVWLYPYSRYNWTFILWKSLTTLSARHWQQQKWLAPFSRKHHLHYTYEAAFNFNASLEIISN